jgi:hypothetical protein
MIKHTKLRGKLVGDISTCLWVSLTIIPPIELSYKELDVEAQKGEDSTKCYAEAHDNMSCHFQRFWVIKIGLHPIRRWTQRRIHSAGSEEDSRETYVGHQSK